MLGDGPLVPSVLASVAERQLDSSVRLLGFLSHAEYLKEVDRADIFLHPRITAADGDTEGGAPPTILEAQALGLPVVSTYHADIPNVVVPDGSALLVPERDSRALANALSRLLDLSANWAEMGRMGRVQVETRHNIEREVVSLEEKYFALLRARHE